MAGTGDRKRTGKGADDIAEKAADQRIHGPGQQAAAHQDMNGT